MELETSNDLFELGNLVADHVDNCYAREKELAENINNAESIETLRTISW
jgi:hypothetical protein